MDTASATSAVMRVCRRRTSDLGDGVTVRAVGCRVRRPVAKIGMSLVTQPPGLATPLHSHSREAEGLYLLAGSIALQGR